MRPKPRMDVLDLDSLKELVRSRGWALIVARIEKLKRSKIAELCEQQPESTTAKLRGQIAMCDVMLKVPSILIDEGTSTRSKEERQE